MIVLNDHFFFSMDLGIYSMRLLSSESSITLISCEVRPPTPPNDFSISFMC